MAEQRIPASHPSFNVDLLLGSPEKAVAAFVECGDLSVDAQGRVWRMRRKVGGNHPRMADLEEPVRAENVVKSGRHQVQVYVLGKRIICLAYRLVWYLSNGDLPEGHHIHHLNKNTQDNSLSNLACISGSEHISSHNIGRVPKSKGTKTGDTEAYKKSVATRKLNHVKRCHEAKRLWENGLSADAISEIQGVCTRQVYSRLQYAEANCDVQ